MRHSSIVNVFVFHQSPLAASLSAMNASYTLEWLLALLEANALIDKEQGRSIRAKAPDHRARLSRQEAGNGRNQHVSPAQIIASLELKLKDHSTLTESRMMREIATKTGFAYHKIDPLKLDAKLITSTLSRPFATRHSLLPLARTGRSLRIATDNPFNYEAFESLHQFCEFFSL